MVRLPVYQRILAELVRTNVATVSSEQLAALAAVNAAKVRKDLSLLGSFGTRGSGYDPTFLIAQIERALGRRQELVDRRRRHRQSRSGPDQLAGVRLPGLQRHGALRRRPGRHRGRDQGPAGPPHGRDRLAALDGTPGHRGDHHARAGRPRRWPTSWCEVGVTSLLNFAPRVLTVPSHVHLRYVDLSIELQVLGFYRSRQDEPALGESTATATGCRSSGRWASPLR